jgi:prevent-host-death family protein
MRTVGSRELKNRLGRYLRMVGKGESLILTNRGKAVAKVIPVSSTEGEKAKTLDDVLNQLEAKGLLHRAKGSFKNRKFAPVVTNGKPASQMILEDRE